MLGYNILGEILVSVHSETLCKKPEKVHFASLKKQFYALA